MPSFARLRQDLAQLSRSLPQMRELTLSIARQQGWSERLRLFVLIVAYLKLALAAQLKQFGRKTVNGQRNTTNLLVLKGPNLLKNGKMCFYDKRNA